MGCETSGMSVEEPRVSRIAGVMLPACRGGVRADTGEAAGFYAADKEFLSWQETSVMPAAHPSWQAKSSDQTHQGESLPSKHVCSSAPPRCLHISRYAFSR